MRDLSIAAFAEEFEKVAWGAPAATLGAVGALVGGVKGYGDAGPSAGTTGSLMSAGKGALMGGAAGATVGGGLGLAGKHLGGTAAGWSKSVGDFGRRQVHAVTGYVPGHIPAEKRVEYLKGIGIGGGNTQAALTEAQQNADKVRSTTGLLPQSWRQAYANWGVRGAQAAHDANEVFLRNGATSLPGMVKAFRNKATRGETLKAVGKDLAFGGGTLGTLSLGLGAGDLYHGVAGTPHPEEAGMGRGEILGRAVGNATGWLLPSPIPVAGQLIGNEALRPVVGAMGRSVDKLMGNRAVASTPTVAPPGGMV